ncbi:hypothetical protein QFZ77_007509 [Paenibacillus sp. V4I3]|uniref:DUF3221 domain-containing protein n=1 Tax=Paenibacillus sp. V4I3 TaxID=3042305 RepID=UPI002789E0C6|nr:DUF3221 domain-containing protein [Paenibacillus sp. V4I3]MDQ0878850.1 hypothetical protein [Paenibacillus sp. V4I3]
MKKLVLGVTFVLVLCMHSGCSTSSEAEKGNYIISKEDQRILVAKNISRKDSESNYATLKNNKVEFVNYIVEDSQLYNELRVGEKVNVTPKTNDKGEYAVMQSDPPQIVADKIERQKE